MKKTAVDQLIYKIHQELDWFYPKVRLSQKLVDEMKQLEKEQIRDAFNSGMNDSVDYFIPFLEPNDESENYYNETFKSE